MTSMHAGIPISDLKPIDMSNVKRVHVSEMDAEDFQRTMDMQLKMLEHKYAQMPDLSSNPRHQYYAEVVVNGKTIAKLNNYGGAETSNALGARLQKGLPMEGKNGEIGGPALAQARAEYIAEMMGGKVVKSSTAITQREFNATPEAKVRIDYEAMKQDPLYKQWVKTQQSRTEYMAQQIAQNQQENSGAAFSPAEAVTDINTEEERQAETRAAGEAAKQEFLDYMNLTPEERYYEAVLRELGLTQEELEALPPDERLKVEEKIKEEIAKRMALQQEEQGKKDQEAAEAA